GLAEGYPADASGLKASAIGGDTIASGTMSTAIGWGAVATADNTVSFGNASAGVYRELVNIADPTSAHSAVNLEYLQAHYPTTSSLQSQMSQLRNEFDTSDPSAQQEQASAT